jgi:chorismate dehydratase
LIWSFLYGSYHGRVEIVLDNAPARSAELLATDRVDAALVPVGAYQSIEAVRVLPDVCVGAREKVRSVCIISTNDRLEDARLVALDVSSRTSVLLTKIIFKEFLGFEPEWRASAPDIDLMLAEADTALLIGDPALKLASRPRPGVRVFDLASLWRSYTGLGFIFAMWMTKRDRVGIDFAAARDEGLRHVEEIVSNYEPEIHLGREEMLRYLTENITYEPDEGMLKGMELYFELAERHGLIALNKPVRFV